MIKCSCRKVYICIITQSPNLSAGLCNAQTINLKMACGSKITVAAMFVFAGSTFAADIDLGENYHVPDGFSSILITSSDGTAIQNAVDHIQAEGTITLSGDFHLKKSIVVKKNLTLDNLKLTGGLFLEWGSVTLNNTKFLKNTAMRAGSYESRSASIKWDDKTVFEGNISYWDYIYVGNSNEQYD